MVGIPGVGKTTLLTKLVEKIKDHHKTVSVNSFGTLMFQVAQENGIKDRDELRKLPVFEQRNLQKIEAKKLASVKPKSIKKRMNSLAASAFLEYLGIPCEIWRLKWKRPAGPLGCGA